MSDFDLNMTEEELVEEDEILDLSDFLKYEEDDGSITIVDEANDTEYENASERWISSDVYVDINSNVRDQL